MKFIILSFIVSSTFFLPQKKESTPVKETITINENDSLKLNAFEILKTKCNVCHQRRNRKRVFTLDNMNGFGKKIYKQVFKWKRMPKGRKIKLTKKEYDQLSNWLSSINIRC
ncbi:MAG: hypothetical protein AB8H03_03340 [Saprospiraceae bacterium]